MLNETTISPDTQVKKETFVICVDLLMDLGIDRKTAEDVYEDILKKAKANKSPL